MQINCAQKGKENLRQNKKVKVTKNQPSNYWQNTQSNNKNAKVKKRRVQKCTDTGC